MKDMSGPVGDGSESNPTGGLHWFRQRQFGRNRVLLREPERCFECGSVYISLYPLSRCVDHEGLEEI